MLRYWRLLATAIGRECTAFLAFLCSDLSGELASVEALYTWTLKQDEDCKGA